jgi:hypothetical protein
MKRQSWLLIVAVSLVVMFGCDRDKPKSGEVLDEAMRAGRSAASLPGADEDYLRDMDYGLTKDPEAVRAALDPYVPGISAEDAVKAVAIGRNNWNIWTAGNDVLWERFARKGFIDLLKIISNHNSLKFSRDNRWYYLGVVNEPCFKKPTEPNQDRFGLWLDVRDPNCPPDPFENEEKYPGVAIGARGKNIPLGSYYGYASGVLGLRLFPNPDFDEAAQKNWDPERYYTDPSYYNDKGLIRPYRVGMACGFCHIGPNPTNPPADPENPKYENLNSNPGAQYFWIDRIFVWDADMSNFVYQLLHTSRPGALDTSLVSSDQINNPRTMNAVYSLAARVQLARKWGKEILKGSEQNNKQFSDYVPPDSPLMNFYKKPDTVWTPRVLKDGADSVGALGALNRVFVNIGLFSEEWLLHFIPLVGGAHITPFPIATAQKNSAYWQATEAQTPNTALFFLASAQPDYLKKAPGGETHLQPEDSPEIVRGQEVFAERCARCHSSKLPEQVFTDFFPDDGCVGPNYLKCWNDYWAYTKTDAFKEQMKALAAQPDFREDNFFSNELRIPVTLLETNACSPLATNALKGDTWNDFSSSSYKALPAVGKIQVHHPLTGEPREYDMPGGGRGYTRPASLISLWSTAPFLLNNTVGEFNWTGTVEDRMASFDDAITKLLWPEKRKGDKQYMSRSGKLVPGVIDRTTEESFLRLQGGFLPDFLQPLVGFFSRWLPWLFGEGGVEIGPIPKGTPINLISNIDLSSSKVQLLKLLLKIKRDLKALPQDATDEQGRAVFAGLVEPLLDVNKCPDFVVNRGHYFGTDYLPESEGEPGLSDADKNALIEFLKTL